MIKLVVDIYNSKDEKARNFLACEQELYSKCTEGERKLINQAVASKHPKEFLNGVKLTVSKLGTPVTSSFIDLIDNAMNK